MFSCGGCLRKIFHVVVNVITHLGDGVRKSFDLVSGMYLFEGEGKVSVSRKFGSVRGDLFDGCDNVMVDI